MAINNITSVQAAASSRLSTNDGGEGMVRHVAAEVTPNADDTAASIQRFVRIPSNARVISAKITAADATTAGAINVGVYYSADYNNGAVIDADLFASAFDLAGGPYARAELIAESGELTVAERLQPLWEAAGLTEDPHGFFDVAATISTTFNGGPTSIFLEVEYVV